VIAVRVKVTIARHVIQYAEVLVPGVESVDEARMRITTALQTTGPVRVRLLKRLDWFGADLEEGEWVALAEDDTGTGTGAT